MLLMMFPPSPDPGSGGGNATSPPTTRLRSQPRLHCHLKQTQDLYLQDPGSDNAEATSPTFPIPNTLLTHCVTSPGCGLKREKNKSRRPNKNKVLKTGYLSRKYEAENNADAGFKKCLKRINLFLSHTKPQIEISAKT